MNPEELRRQLENGNITWAEYLDTMSSLQSSYPQGMYMSTGQRTDSPTGYERRFGTKSSMPTTGQYESQEDYIEQMQEAQAGSPDAKSYEQLAQEYDQLGQPQGGGQTTGQGAFMGPRYLNPWGGDMNTNAYMLGRAFGSEKGSRGRGLGIASGIGNLGLGLARTIGSGVGYAKRYDETMDTYRRNRTMDRTYTNQPSYYDTNMTGGQMGKYGGEKKYEYGGKADSTPIDRYQRIMNSRSYMKKGGKKMYQNGGDVEMLSELDMLMQLKNVGQPNFAPDEDNRLKQLDTNLNQFMEEGGEIQQEQNPQQGQPEIDPELLQIAQEMAQEFSSVEEAQAYLEQEGVRPEMIEQVLELFLMVLQEQGQQQQQERQPASSGVMRNTMAGDMSMEFRYGGRRKYPKL